MGHLRADQAFEAGDRPPGSPKVGPERLPRAGGIQDKDAKGSTHLCRSPTPNLCCPRAARHGPEATHWNPTADPRDPGTKALNLHPRPLKETGTADTGFLGALERLGSGGGRVRRSSRPCS